MVPSLSVLQGTFTVDGQFPIGFHLRKDTNPHLIGDITREFCHVHLLVGAEDLGTDLELGSEDTNLLFVGHLSSLRLGRGSGSG